MVSPASTIRKKGTNFHRYLRDKLLPILASRAVIFLFFMCLLTLFLYAAGTVQEFTDSTQLALLRLHVVLGIFLSVISICGMLLNLRRLFILKKVRYLFRAGRYMFLVIFATATVLGVMFIIAVSGGNA